MRVEGQVTDSTLLRYWYASEACTVVENCALRSANDFHSLKRNVRRDMGFDMTEYIFDLQYNLLSAFEQRLSFTKAQASQREALFDRMHTGLATLVDSAQRDILPIESAILCRLSSHGDADSRRFANSIHDMLVAVKYWCDARLENNQQDIDAIMSDTQRTKLTNDNRGILYVKTLAHESALAIRYALNRGIPDSGAVAKNVRKLS